MSKRIDQCFQRARSRGQKVLIPFFTAGDPSLAVTVPLMHRLVEGGADLLELGIPFSDPMADGPVIQASSERAIERGVGLAQVLSWVRQFRERDPDTPVVLMGYMNPIERFGISQFTSAAAQAGVDGLLMVDCPPEELGGLQEALSEQDIDIIRLVAPTTSEARSRMITKNANGFIYYVSFKGTTGAGSLDSDSLEKPVSALRTLSNLPVVVGFGIKDSQSAKAVAAHADGVVIGSALVERLASADSDEQALDAALEFVAAIRSALDQYTD